MENNGNISEYASHYSGFIETLRVSDMQCYLELNESAPLTVEESAAYGYTRSDIHLITVLMPAILTLGVGLNSAFVYVVFRIEQMRTITNRYLSNLAVADILFLVSAIGPKLVQFATTPFALDDSHLGSIGCVSMYFLIDTSYFSSLCFITLTSLDRFVALCRPLNRNSIVARQSKKLICASWILSGILAASLTPANGNLGHMCVKWADASPYTDWPMTIRYCLPIRQWMTTFSVAVQTFPFFITCAFNTYIYASIIKVLNRSMEFKYGKFGQQLSISTQQKTRDFRARNQVVKMLVFNGVIFFVCLCPYELYSLFFMIASLRQWKFLISNYTVRKCLLTIARILSYGNAAINPIIYTAMCKPYKRAFNEAFCWKWRRKTSKVTRSSTLLDTVYLYLK